MKNDNKNVYGICSNRTDYSVIIYNGKDFKSLYQFQVIVPDIFTDPDFEDEWVIQRYSLIVEIIHTVLSDKNLY